MLGGAKSVRPSFISYVQSIPSETESLKQVEPSLLPGEVVIAEASDVFKCNSSEENGQRLRGTLICTTLKVSFLPNLSLDEQQESLYKNRLLGEHDVSLTCVDQLHAVHDGKKKQLLPSSGIKYSPEVLIIHCKNFRIIKFYFENTDQNESRKLINAIVYHCHPSSLRLLFAFEFLQASPTEVYPVKGRTRETGVKRGESPVSMVQHSDQNISESPGRLGPFSNNSGTTLFESPEDWEFEMTRAKTIGWRVTRVNEAFKISKSLPEFFVVSSLLRDSDVKEAAVHFQDERGPIWIWSHTSGASLIKMAKLRSDTEQIGQEQRMLSTLPMPHLGTPYVADLSKELPDLPEVQAAFLKLKHICMQDTAEAFWLSDNKWLSSLENTGWLECVWQCLRISAKLAEEMTNNGHVVIREIDCRDMCCVVASLVQVLLDAQSRTIVGFQSLIQKEWVLAGHRFLDRLNHLQLDVGEAPVFQLFLDCMWQLLQQNPETFEFGETYLTVLSDSTRIPLFGTFLFNSQYQRDTESLESKAERYIRTDYKSARLPSVWDWSLQFGPEAQWLLRNPQFVQEKPTVTQRHLPLEAFGALGRKNSSSPMALLQSLRKGVLGEDGDTFRKGSLRHLRTPRHSYSSEELRMVATPPGLLSPCLASPLLRLWEQCYLRWLPQIPILGGGSVVAKQRLACLRQEIEVLHARLNTLQDMATPTESSLDQHLNNRCPLELSLQPSIEYSPGTPDSLFSTFPFVPTGILSHRTVPITPLSRLLFGRSASGEALAVDDYNGRI